ncbi:exosortase/archaeosortase family protein [Tautonia plasticadhaerens]|uniref:Transmembrane exosortase (Exosortase_EpsH) n=1 Tax=Tautonia plasticadhaerens TaxID=2527974 RepID=A0A518HFQ7_9BACT|nr:exosortase/archaeosortase family protein [Tautonia plasticadhaerens]QDV39626.1 Transmembrane exosortase (Exosortase_EpsH) [Tautonia plasticadhaerens]
MSQPTDPRPATQPALAAIAARLVAPAVVLVVLVWAYLTEVTGLVESWSNDPNYSHGFLVGPVVAFMFWWLWPRGAEADRIRPSAWGWVLLVALVAARFSLFQTGEYWLEGFTLVPTVAALVLAYGGWPLLRRTWPAVAFLIFMYPIPAALNSQVSLPLQRMASISSATLLRLLGFWVMDEGNVLVVGGEQLEVAAACNGLAMLMSLAATIAATVIFVPMAVWKRIVLLLSVVPVALLCNVLRIAGTAYAYHLLGSEQGEKVAHDVAGWLMMPMALVMVLLELAWLSWLVTEVEVEEPVSPTLLATSAGLGRPSR